MLRDAALTLMVGVNPMFAMMMRLSLAGRVSMLPENLLHRRTSVLGSWKTTFPEPGWWYSLHHFALLSVLDFVPR